MRRHLVPVAAYALLTTVGLYGTAAAMPESRLAASLPGTGTVDSGDIIDGQVKGVDVAEGSLGTVPNATKVGGLQVKKFHRKNDGYSQRELLFTMGTLKVSYYCGEGIMGGGYLPWIELNTTVDNASLMRTSIGNTNPQNPNDSAASVQRIQDVDFDHLETGYAIPSNGSLDVGYHGPTGTTVTLHIEGDNNQDGSGTPTGYEAWGTAIGG